MWSASRLTAPEAVVRSRLYLRRLLGKRLTGRHLIRRVRSVRFPGECPRPHQSTTVRLIRPDDPPGHPGLQDRPHASTTVVSTVLAVGPCIRWPLTFRFSSGELGSRVQSPVSPMLDSLAVASFTSTEVVYGVTGTD